MQLQPGSSCGKKVETALQYCYFFSIALSPLGPVCHYSLWGVCFLLLLWSFFVCRRPLALRGLPRDGAAVFVLLAGMALWTALAGLFSFDKIAYYGRNVTPLFEIVFGAYLAMRTLRDEQLRRRFITIFAVLRPTPGSFCSSSYVRGTSPPYSDSTIWAHLMQFAALTRKKPIDRSISSTSCTSAAARSSMVGKRFHSTGVTLFTAASVVCADSSTAMVKRNGSPPKSRAGCAAG